MADTNSNGADKRALVIGAGPVGLTAAISLKSRGRDVTVLEAESADRVRPGSRAIYIHGATLRTLENIRPGLGMELVERGVVWQTRRTLYRGKEVFSRTYDKPFDTDIPHFTSLSQVEIEWKLLRACIRDGVNIVWGAPVTALESRADGVTVETAHVDQWAADYVIAADGASSVARKQIGVEMEGSRSINSYVIADVAEDRDNPLPVERIFHYEHPGVGGRNVLLVPFAGGWRADLQCFDMDDPEEFSTGDGLRRWLAATLGENYPDRLTWVSTYQFVQVIAREFTDAHHRVLLTGEAAHLFAPFGARGLNSGVPDADSATEAVAKAMAAENPGAAREAVARFAAERRAAAEWNRAAAGIALEHLTARSAGARLKRRAAALIAPWWEPAGEWLDRAPYGPRTGTPVGSKY